MHFQSEESDSSRKIALAVVVMSAVLVLGAVLYLFGGYHVPVEDMYDDVRVVEEDGRISFEFSMTDSGTTGIEDEISRPVVYDYENGIKYHYHFMKITAQRFHVFVNPGVTPNPYFVLDENYREVHSGDDWRFDERIDYEAHPEKMATRYLRVYYVDPNGAVTLLWEHPEAAEILQRTDTKLREPEYYMLGNSKT